MKRIVMVAFLGAAINAAVIPAAHADGGDWGGGDNPIAQIGGAVLGGMIGGVLAQAAPYVAGPAYAAPPPAYVVPAAPAYGYQPAPYPAPPAYPAYPAYQQPGYAAPYPVYRGDGEGEDH